MIVLERFCLQESRPAALYYYLVKGEVLVILNMGWFIGQITRKSLERTK